VDYFIVYLYMEGDRTFSVIMPDPESFDFR